MRDVEVTGRWCFARVVVLIWCSGAVRADVVLEVIVAWREPAKAGYPAP